MLKMAILRLAFMVFLVFGIFKVGYFIGERNEINKNDPQVKESSPQKIAEPPKKDIIFEDITFPEYFFFGTASSDFQTTGGNGLTDWNEYVETLKPPLTGPGVGTDFLNRYREDIFLAKQFGDQVHRLSLEWARIEPEEGKFDKGAVEKYKEIFLYMRNHGIEPMVCLNHFALPLWFVEKGGWESPEAAFYYSRYAGEIAGKIGKPLKIKWWLTFNEPQMMLIPYLKGIWPPNKPIQSFQDSDGVQRVLRVASNLIDAHRLSYRNIYSVMDSRIMVSFASAPGSFYPYDFDSPLDQIAVNVHNMVNTLLFDYAVGRTDRDFVGLNYYGRNKLKLHISWWKNVLPWLSEEKPFAIEWETPIQRKQGLRPKEFYPRGLYDMIFKFKDLNLPIVITENGLSDAEDKFREEFMVLHLKAISDAIKDGAPVIGYQYWALTDTWEWDGVFSQMGLISIDRNNDYERKLRPSALTYGEIIKTRKIKKELLEKHKELLVQQ